MGKYVLKRIGYILLVGFILSLLLYLLYNCVPNDPALKELEASRMQMMKEPAINPLLYPNRYAEAYAEMRLEYALDEPIFMRYLYWLGLAPWQGKWNGLLQGNFGYSWYYKKDVVEMMADPMKNTIFINIFATIFGLGITIPLGIFCAVKRGSKRDTGIQVFSIIGYSIPTFIIAIVFIWIFAVLLGWFPVSGMESLNNSDMSWIGQILDRLYYMALPLIVMTFCSLGGMIRYVRASMIDALSMDCIRTARAKGLREKTVIYSHAWKNALIPVVTLVIGWFLGIFSGSVIIEQTFSLNGIGKLYITALNAKDFDVVMALQMFYVFLGLIGNLVIDLVYGLVDPRVRVSK